VKAAGDKVTVHEKDAVSVPPPPFPPDPQNSFLTSNLFG
jgi:hypothetical protein